jgi:thiamine-monophosphate kinase
MTTGAAPAGTEQLQSEEAIIQRFLAPLAAAFPGAHGLKDDCAVAAPRPGFEFVFKTDAIAEGVHFLPTDAPADIGWKALAVNVSDLAAKGAVPVGYLMSLAFPQAPTAGWMEAFARGLAEAQAAFGIHLMGGDTDRRPGPMSVTPMVIGEVPAGRMVRRASARAGDVILVSGTLGDSTLGLHLVRDAASAQKWRLDERRTRHLTGRFLRPQPRIGLSGPLLEHARAGMDLSDGLMKDLGRMCRASGVGAIVEHTALPVSDAFAAVRQTDPVTAAAALFAGDDYEILTAIPPENVAAFSSAAAAAGVSVTEIGRFTSSGDVVLRDASGAAMVMSATGWDHF